jgi:tetratricopeptide (TPR) repeat protein
VEKRAAALQREVESSPPSFDLHIRLASAYGQLGQYQEAGRHCEEAARLAPSDDATAHFQLGVVYILAGQLLSATEECMALDELSSRHAAALAAMLQEYSHPDVTFDGGPGDTMETAVLIRGAPTHSIGVNAEYSFLARQFGTRGADWELTLQSLVLVADRKFDKMEVELVSGEQRVVFFDVTGFWCVGASREGGK